MEKRKKIDWKKALIESWPWAK